MKRIGEITEIDYIVINESKNYDASVTINCTADGSSEYISISNKLDGRNINEINELDPLEIKSQKEKSGKIKIEQIRSYAGDGKLNISITCELTAHGIEKGNEVEVSTAPIVPKLCKRAEELHSDGIHTYGSLGVNGVLTSGDAFDCDVDGKDGYNRETERFYYVTDLDIDTAVLIYSANTNAGVYNPTKTIAYNLNNVNNMGPITAKDDLPTKDQWITQLYSNPRQITNQNGLAKTSAGNIAIFDYENKAARLITAQEVNSACGISVGGYSSGELNNCMFLMENTKFDNSSMPDGYWLESPGSTEKKYVWRVNGNWSNVNHCDVSETYSVGVRPVIEVKKSNIEY